MHSFILPLAFSTLAAAQSFSRGVPSASTPSDQRPALDWIRFASVRHQLKSAPDGPSKGQLQGGTVNVGISADVCSQFFATNSTPTNLSSGPILGGSSSVTTTAKAVQSAIPASAAATSAAAPAASAKSASAAVHAGYVLIVGAVASISKISTIRNSSLMHVHILIATVLCSLLVHSATATTSTSPSSVTVASTTTAKASTTSTTSNISTIKTTTTTYTKKLTSTTATSSTTSVSTNPSSTGSTKTKTASSKSGDSSKSTQTAAPIGAPLPAGAIYATPDATRSTAGILDTGYPPGTPESGEFVSGWYNDIYWRPIGTPSYIAGAKLNATANLRKRRLLHRQDASSLDRFYSTQGLDQGYAKSRVMLLVRGQVLFCRALTGSTDGVKSEEVVPLDAPVACVLFDSLTGQVRDANYLKDVLGTYSAFEKRGMKILSPQQQDTTAFSEVGASDVDDIDLTMGFKRGWYGGVYWRVCGEFPDQFVAGGVAGNEYMYNTYGLDQGISGTLVVAEVPGLGRTFCRGVGREPASDPYFACVLLSGGQVVEQYALYKRLGQRSDYRDLLEN
ncbi:hypothetical protein CcCBS67573_g06075 [Chytriomyces confervae]|uniref:Uncharacterized protein n=1 Tax=Chytriomyces confervae TaxID=246404 RepID=A0A507F8J1_9FUNG|nr:hypothetical protein CcCBS67573_g06075 [Chytriomyces confervae]